MAEDKQTVALDLSGYDVFDRMEMLLIQIRDKVKTQQEEAKGKLAGSTTKAGEKQSGLSDRLLTTLVAIEKKLPTSLSTVSARTGTASTAISATGTEKEQSKNVDDGLEKKIGRKADVGLKNIFRNVIATIVLNFLKRMVNDPSLRNLQGQPIDVGAGSGLRNLFRSVVVATVLKLASRLGPTPDTRIAGSKQQSTSKLQDTFRSITGAVQSSDRNKIPALPARSKEDFETKRAGRALFPINRFVSLLQNVLSSRKDSIKQTQPVTPRLEAKSRDPKQTQPVTPRLEAKSRDPKQTQPVTPRLEAKGEPKGLLSVSQKVDRLLAKGMRDGKIEPAYPLTKEMKGKDRFAHPWSSFPPYSGKTTYDADFEPAPKRLPAKPKTLPDRIGKKSLWSALPPFAQNDVYDGDFKYTSKRRRIGYRDVPTGKVPIGGGRDGPKKLPVPKISPVPERPFDFGDKGTGKGKEAEGFFGKMMGKMGKMWGTAKSAFTEPDKWKDRGEKLQRLGNKAGDRFGGKGKALGAKGMAIGGVASLVSGMAIADPYREDEQGISQAGDTAKGVGMLAGAGMTAMGVPGGPLVAGLGILADVALKTAGKVQEWANKLHEANMRFADFSASMASVQAQQEARDIQLNRERGNRRAKSAKVLAEGKSELDKGLAPIVDGMANIKNYVIGAISDKLGRILQGVNRIVGLMPDKKSDGEREMPASEWIWEIGQLGGHKDFVERKRPDRFR